MGKINRENQVCSRCILDSNDYPEISFDKVGICDICHIYDKHAANTTFNENEREKKLAEIVFEIRDKGKNKKYDCVIGVSGGVDSTFMVYKAKMLGLRPLAVHLDNGWNSELAVNNIENVTKKLGIDLFTYVINWDEFRDIQLSYLKASVVDIEAITDHAITAVLFKTARKFGIKYNLFGENTVTEGILPPSWVHNKSDFMNIKDIHNKFGSVKLKTYPYISFISRMYYLYIYKIKNVLLLNYLDYNKDMAKSTIINELGWRDYGGKHYESIFTKFYQSYILPKKFNIDKRKSHLSTLICSGHITREQALEEIKKPVVDEILLAQDKKYVIKKLGLTVEEFDEIMKKPRIEHTEYKSIMNIYKKLKRIKEFLKF